MSPARPSPRIGGDGCRIPERSCWFAWIYDPVIHAGPPIFPGSPSARYRERAQPDRERVKAPLALAGCRVVRVDETAKPYSPRLTPTMMKIFFTAAREFNACTLGVIRRRSHPKQHCRSLASRAISASPGCLGKLCPENRQPRFQPLPHTRRYHRATSLISKGRAVRGPARMRVSCPLPYSTPSDTAASSHTFRRPRWISPLRHSGMYVYPMDLVEALNRCPRVARMVKASSAAPSRNRAPACGRSPAPEQQHDKMQMTSFGPRKS